MTRYPMIDVGSPRDSISLRTLVETLRYDSVEVHDLLTGERFKLAMEEVQDERERRVGVSTHGDEVT